jgi:hexosaminidase
MSVPAVSLIPQPAHLNVHDGQFLLTATTSLHYLEELASEANYMASLLRNSTGFKCERSAAKQPGQIQLALDPQLSHLGKEGYRLTATTDDIAIVAHSRTGVFYGIQSLLQLLPPAIHGRGPRIEMTWGVPLLEIEDQPRFSWRGAMLDSCRHFQPVEFIRRFIDLLALHKLNTFHWHLTDDQGWRVEIKKYPRLTEVSAWRGGTWLGHDTADSRDDGVPYGGFYTQEQLRDLVRYAAERHITIVPEIEMPGHAQAVIAAYPEFGCTGRKVEVRRRWGISEDIYNPKEETFRFLEDVLLEVMDIFPSQFIHVGGDEALKKHWEESETIREQMTAVGAKDAHEMQSYFIRRMDRFLAEHGRRLIGWDEILEGGLAEGAAVMSWRGVDAGIAAANAGHDVVMTPCTHTYLDWYQSESIATEPLAIGAFLSLEKVYSYEPVANDIPCDKIHHVLGTQAQLWTEYMPTTAHVEYMAFPRLSALAEVAWTPADQRNSPDFHKRLSLHLKRLDALEVRYRPES